MTTDEILDVFRECGALLEGHFILSSGLRSPVFLQKARVFMHPDKAEKLCRALADKLRAEGYGDVSQIVSPAVGGIIPGYETARHLGVPAIYTERVDGQFQLRRWTFLNVRRGWFSAVPFPSSRGIGTDVLVLHAFHPSAASEMDAVDICLSWSSRRSGRTEPCCRSQLNPSCAPENQNRLSYQGLRMLVCRLAELLPDVYQAIRCPVQPRS